ncbi:MAG: hypothetical protein ACYTBX_19440 [Planctomycetota bacterium]
MPRLMHIHACLGLTTFPSSKESKINSILCGRLFKIQILYGLRDYCWFSSRPGAYFYWHNRATVESLTGKLLVPGTNYKDDQQDAIAPSLNEDQRN